MPEFTLRILHISDLHERGENERELWRRRRVLGNAWLQNLRELREDGAFDLVCFTGDAAQSGKEPEYQRVTDFLLTTLQELSVPLERCFLTPGNHDINRDIAPDAWKTLRDNLARVHPQDVSRWFSGGSAPFGFAGPEREAVLSRQAAYRRWVAETLKRPELLPSPQLHPHLGYRVTLNFPHFPFPFHIIGLDSAWLAGDEHDAGKLRLTEDQVMRFSTTEQGDPLSGFRLVLVHHPLDDLDAADAGHCRRLLAERVDLVLRGHLHEPELSEWADPERRLRQLVAGCLYEGHGADHYPNACHALTITLNSEGRPLRYDVRFRGWATHGHWFYDNSLYPGTRDGQKTWWIGATPPQIRLHPRIANVFVGRESELDALAEALLPAVGAAHPVAICSVQGMPGVGKSYLADRFYHDHAAKFPGGYLRLTLDPRQPLTVEMLRQRLLDSLHLPVGGDLQFRLQQPLTLLHIENADSRETAVATASLVNNLSGCPIVVSGRFQGLGESAGWRQLPLRPFDEPTALRQLGQELGTATTDAHADLVRALGALPLAVHLAAGYLRAGHSVQGFLKLLHDRGLHVRPADVADPLLTTDETRAILRTTFALSLELLRGALGENAERLLPGFLALGHGPAAGFGSSLGAAIAGLSELDFEELAVMAANLSLLERRPMPNASRTRWWLHPLLAENVRKESDASTVMQRMTDWFVARLPERPTGDEETQGRLWQEIQDETEALVEWLSRIRPGDIVTVERAGSAYAQRSGPFLAWANFCEWALEADLTDAQRSNVLWTLSQVAHSGGLMDRAMSVAHEKATLDHARADEREVALAKGAQADILQARGQLDEALRIRQEEELPVYTRLGDVRSILVCRANIAITLLHRGNPDDRGVVEEYLSLALADAERLRLPEAQTITNLMEQIGMRRAG